MKKPIKLTLGLLTLVILVGINLLVVYPWFGGSGPADIGSIEVSYVSMARFIKDY